MAGLTQPLEFRRFMGSAPRAGFDVVPFVDAIAICLFVALNVSAFVVAPGTTIQLPESSARQASQAAPAAVLTVDRNELYFFEGDKLSSLTLESHLVAHVESLRRRSANQEPALLIKADASISTAALFQLLDLARRAGFVRVHLAAEPGFEESAEEWGNILGEGGP